MKPPKVPLGAFRKPSAPAAHRQRAAPRARCTGFAAGLLLAGCCAWLPAAWSQDAAGSDAPPTAQPDASADLAAWEARALEDWGNRDFPSAIAGWRRLIAADPNRRHYRLGLVRTLVSAGAIADARRELEAAAKIPAASRSDEYNTLVAEGEVLRAEDQVGLSREAFADAAELSGDNARQRVPSGTSRSGAQRWQFNTGLIVDHFDNERDLETQLLAQLGYTFSNAVSASLLYEQHNRFDTTDDVYLAGVSLRPNDVFALRFDIGGSPNPSFRPRMEGSARIEWLMTDVVHPLFAYQLLDYRQGDVTSYIPGLRFLFGGRGYSDLQYSITEELDGSKTRIGSLRVDWIFARRWAPSFTYHRGEEALPPQMKAKFQRVGAGLTWLVTRSFQLRLDYSYEDREAAYIGQSIAFGAGVNF